MINYTKTGKMVPYYEGLPAGFGIGLVLAGCLYFMRNKAA